MDLYRDHFTRFFDDAELKKQTAQSIEILRSVKRIFFIGNGGSNSICSHMMEDYGKIAGFRTFTFSDAALITCYANDYGYENAFKEWLKLHMDPADLLIAISSSGKSANIINAVAHANSINAKVITLSGFEKGNPLSKMGNVNMHLPVSNYGIVECYHQVLLHMILDSL